MLQLLPLYKDVYNYYLDCDFHTLNLTMQAHFLFYQRDISETSTCIQCSLLLLRNI